MLSAQVPLVNALQAAIDSGNMSAALTAYVHSRPLYEQIEVSSAIPLHHIFLHAFPAKRQGASCRQAAVEGCQNPTPCWTRQIQARPNQPRARCSVFLPPPASRGQMWYKMEHSLLHRVRIEFDRLCVLYCRCWRVHSLRRTLTSMRAPTGSPREKRMRTSRVSTKSNAHSTGVLMLTSRHCKLNISDRQASHVAWIATALQLFSSACCPHRLVRLGNFLLGSCPACMNYTWSGFVHGTAVSDLKQ